MSMPGLSGRSSTFRNDRGNRAYCITVWRIISGRVLKDRKGAGPGIQGRYPATLPGSRKLF